MTYEQLKQLKPSSFKRRCGVHRETFEQIVELLRPHLDFAVKTWRSVQTVCRRPTAFSVGILARSRRRSASGEYRTQFHIATSWGLSESAVCRLIQKVESLLIKSGKFRLPGKKQLYQNAYTWSVLVVDVTETPIERPKKNSELTTVVRKNGIR